MVVCKVRLRTIILHLMKTFNMMRHMPNAWVDSASLSLARSAQIEQDNESCFFMRAALVYKTLLWQNKRIRSSKARNTLIF